MPNVLSFNNLKYQDILEPEFDDFSMSSHNNLEFKIMGQCGMVVVYAPNGMGKTTLSNVLKIENSSQAVDFSAVYNDVPITPEDKRFHIIGDQSTRNIIHGNTSDYLIGEDIRREYELRKIIEDIFNSCFVVFTKTLKEKYRITKRDDYFLSSMNNQVIANYIRDIIPTRNRRSEIDRIEFVHYIKSLSVENIPEIVEEKTIFIVENQQLIKDVLAITAEIEQVGEIQEIEQNDDAIKILNKYPSQTVCVVCDAQNISIDELTHRKTVNRNRIYTNLPTRIKEVLDNIINNSSLQYGDPFSIHARVSDFISTGDYPFLQILQNELSEYVNSTLKNITNLFLQIFDETSLDTHFTEYENLLNRQPMLDNEELMLINEVVNENIGPEITIIRDERNGKNFRLLLDGEAFLGDDVGDKNQKPLKLSTGERNFISLAFELLLARHSDKEFVVLDDPISSFDSIYKNKIAYCIIKFLEKKKCIILTHNLELVRLLEFQNSGCFNLYMFNNTNGGVNGFVRVNDLEKKILNNLHDLIKLFRNGDPSTQLCDVVIDIRIFLMAMIPFLRGYAHIICTENDIYSSLSSIMHGYENGSVDVNQIYQNLFGYDFGEECVVSVQDILDFDCTNVRTVDPVRLPLLSETLKQTLLYYHLRMCVESTLVELFPASRRHDEDAMLGQIIQKAFKCDRTDPNFDSKLQYRVFFTSRKTLLNEFNHFEGNMNIFQPAIDIEDNALQREVDAIHEKLALLRIELNS
ncbi:AAA family ATPase [Hydrogenoanaerobacterium sp.]|uniref:AAA family ATPase n=1 Tax=Hydrogenoanaerobacterium sp. TaxID=2953763 RepID=UPI00289C8B5A|nr:AAA family ATPase [Hydrogenoanaerobacterium sp.]